MTLRGLLLAGLVVGGLAWGSGAAGQEAPRLASQADPQAYPYRAFVPAAGFDGPATAVHVSTHTAYQGGAIRVFATRGDGGSVTIFGRDYPLLPDAQGTLLAFVGVGVLDPPGETSLSIVIEHASEPDETLIDTVTILETDWTVDYIEFTPDPNAPGGNPLDPANIAAENALLTQTYGGVTHVKWNGAWLAPLTAPISGYFGEQRSINGGPVSGHHGGTDFSAVTGTPVMATNEGVVVISRSLIVRGNMVIIDHGAGVFSGYAHLSSLAVSEGQHVAKGQVIGAVGSTGFSTGPHLHWEMSVRGVLVDGLRWLDGSQGY